MVKNYEEESFKVISRFIALHLTPERLMKIGAFVVCYGQFETTLERALWTLREIDVKGVRPFTEKLPSDKWFEYLGNGNDKLSNECNTVLNLASLAAIDLAYYRNSLVHGYLLPLGDKPSFMRNPRWHGELRNKRTGDAYIEEPLLDLAIISGWTLFRVVSLTEKIFEDESAEPSIVMLENEVREARSCTNELRHLRSLMNEEKY